jgi:hypothetical protein
MTERKLGGRHEVRLGGTARLVSADELFEYANARRYGLVRGTLASLSRSAACTVGSPARSLPRDGRARSGWWVTGAPKRSCRAFRVPMLNRQRVISTRQPSRGCNIQPSVPSDVRRLTYDRVNYLRRLGHDFTF